MKILQNRPKNLMTHTILGLLAILCVLPLIFVISTSLSDEQDITRNGYAAVPRVWSTEAYKMLFKDPEQIISSYSVSIFVTAVGSFLGLTISSMVAYVTTRRSFKPYRFITIFVFFPLLFQAGLVPFYIYVVRVLHLKDTLTILILPYLVVPWLVLLLKGYMAQIPPAVVESGQLDGAGEVTIFFRLVAPMSKSALATVGLFFILHYWNDWWLSLLFISNKAKIPLQLLLQQIMNNAEFMRSSLFRSAAIGVDLSTLPGESARMATALIVAGPVLLAFPFIQKYLVRGITVGSIKG